MVDKIDIKNVTKAHIDELMPKYVEEWRKNCLRTGTVNRSAAKKAVELLCKCNELPMPKKIFFVRSPREAVQLLAVLYRFKHQHKEPQGQSVYMNNLRKHPVTPDEFQTAHRNAGWVYGNQQTWLAFYKFLEENTTVPSLSDRLAGLYQVAASCGWTLMATDVVIVSDFPTEIHVTEDGKPHNLKGPAVTFADGTKDYAIDGVPVPAWVITTPVSKVTAAQILSLTNVEQRVKLINRIGVPRMLKVLKAKLVDIKYYSNKPKTLSTWYAALTEVRKNPTDLEYKLYKPDLTDRVALYVLEMICPSDGEVHHEWVGADTIAKALTERNGTDAATIIS